MNAELMRHMRRIKTPVPGDMLSLIILKVTGEHACGPCNAKRKQMNEWKWWGCWKNRKTIIQWVCEEAAKRGHDVSPGEVMPLFKAVFREIASLL